MGIVRAVCVSIGENARRKTGVLSEDIAAILLCTALYLHPKSSHALYVQFTRISCCFFNAMLYCKLVYIHGKSAYSVRLYCRKCALKDGCFIRRYHSESAMYITQHSLQWTSISSWTCTVLLHRYIVLIAIVFYLGKVLTVCAYIAENARWKTGVLFDDIPAILPCTALYLHLKYIHLFYVQYTRVSSWFLISILFVTIIVVFFFLVLRLAI